MYQITTSNGKKVSFPDDTDICYYQCCICEKYVILFWDKKKVQYSEFYVTEEQITALVLRGLQHRRVQENLEGEPDEDVLHSCDECMQRKSGTFSGPPNDDDYAIAYGSVDPYSEEYERREQEKDKDPVDYKEDDGCQY